jgi:hypothetical protein
MWMTEAGATLRSSLQPTRPKIPRKGGCVAEQPNPRLAGGLALTPRMCASYPCWYRDMPALVLSDPDEGSGSPSSDQPSQQASSEAPQDHMPTCVAKSQSRQARGLALTHVHPFSVTGKRTCRRWCLAIRMRATAALLRSSRPSRLQPRPPKTRLPCAWPDGSCLPHYLALTHLVSEPPWRQHGGFRDPWR